MDNASKVSFWAHEALIGSGVDETGKPEMIQQTPWSSVIRIATTRGNVYLKQTAPGLSLEPVIMHVLSSQQHAPVPEIIAINKSLNCFLMNDCGQPLRALFENNFQPGTLCQAIKEYTKVQKSSFTQVSSLMRLGVPDWRLQKLPSLYEQLLGREDFLRNDGLSASDLKQLHALSSKVADLCRQLANYAVPETLDHCDFHSGNILINNYTKKLTIIDWGETVITQPFFSVLGCIDHAIRYHGLVVGDNNCNALRDACLQTWSGVTAMPKLIVAFQLAHKLWPLYAALGFYRLTMNSRLAEFIANPRNVGRIAQHLQEFCQRIK